jgi:hypothetical protein
LIPFCFIDEDLIKELKINKNDLSYINIKTENELFSTKFAPVNSKEILDLENFNHLNDYNFIKNDIFSGVDWIYSFVESVYAYNFRIFYYKYYNTFFDDSCDYFYNLF